MTRSIETISIENWVMKVQRPAGPGPFPVLLLLHGWTGDENSMWIFAPRLPGDAILIAPRGLYPSRSKGGYSWHAEIPMPWPWVNDFIPAVRSLLDRISDRYFSDGDLSQLHLLGFSQGAALAYCLAITHPEKVVSVAGLSGFLPDGGASWLSANRLNGLPVFIAHGTEDQLVPVERARNCVGALADAGAEVTYCEDSVGHKLSTKCFHGLEAFYKKINC
jgi:phospholipase/carboxylesterase